MDFKKTLKILIVLLISTTSLNSANSEEGYMFGGIKVFDYGIKKSDLQEINTSLIASGFSSSTSSTDNTGVGFDLGFGVNLSDTIAFEAGYVPYGTLEINTTLTGPAETVKTEIDGDGFTGAAVLKLGEESDYAYLKGGFHSWSFTGKVTASLGSSTEPLGTGTDPFFAIGYRGSNIYASYDYYAIEDGDISSFSIGYAVPF